MLHYTIFYTEHQEELGIINSFKDNKNVRLIKARYKDKNIFEKVLRKLARDKTKWYPFKASDIDKDEIIIFYPSIFWVFDKKDFFEYIKGHKYYTVFLDSMHPNTPAPLSQRELMNFIEPKSVFSFDKNDCNEFGFNYLNEAYYPKNDFKKSDKIEYDAYFVGRLRPGREKDINKIYRLLKKHDVSSKFYLVADKTDIQNYGEPKLEQGLSYTFKTRSYKEVLEDTSKANCIIEIAKSGQNAPTFRYFEAVTLGKKLLTTITYTEKLNFYNKKYMKITDLSEKSIDFNWMKKREKIDYKYNNEFSPLILLDLIKKIEETT